AHYSESRSGSRARAASISPTHPTHRGPRSGMKIACSGGMGIPHNAHFTRDVHSVYGSSRGGGATRSPPFRTYGSSLTMSTQTLMHSSQMHTLFGPAISFRTDAWSLWQNEQRSEASLIGYESSKSRLSSSVAPGR